MRIYMIAAVNSQGVIGKDNKIPWFYKGDLKFFKDKTTGHVVIMGRKTWESLPAKMRPLPNRVNIILTSKPEEVGSGDNQVVASTLKSAIEIAQSQYPDKDIWLIGGAGVYEEGMKLANEVVVTNVPDELTDLDGVVRFPLFTNEWALQSTSVHPESAELHVSTWVRR